MGRPARLAALTLFAGAALAVAALAAGVLYAYELYRQPGPLTEDRAVIVPKGASTTAIAERLTVSGVIAHPLIFRAGVRLQEAEGALNAGEYVFPTGASVRDVIEDLRLGNVHVRRLTVPEGYTSAQVVAMLQAADDLAGDVARVPADGELLPETYHYTLGDDREALLERMKEAMRAAQSEAWQARAEDLPLKTPEEALILASIVEKETGLAQERARVAAVFINRLRLGMRLQADPTVAFAAGEDGNPIGRALTQADLNHPSPYNTYVHDGLPPGPIGNPGRAALAAVLNPAETDELYFVADGSGGHAFARTLAEHNRNVARWRALERARTP
jgi:UPF0755 protein